MGEVLKALGLTFHKMSLPAIRIYSPLVFELFQNVWGKYLFPQLLVAMDLWKMSVPKL